MVTNHKISSAYDGYHGAVKAKELHSQKQLRHGKMHTGLGKEGSSPELRIRDGFDKNYTPLESYGGQLQPREKTGESSHRHGEIGGYRHNRVFDRHDFAGRQLQRKDDKAYSKGNLMYGVNGIDMHLGGKTQIYMVTVAHSVFNGSGIAGPAKRDEAYQNFLNAALGYIRKPNEQTYKSLSDSMIKLMDPRFTPAVAGGAAQISIRSSGGMTMVKFGMEITPAPTKTLEEAREDLKNAYSSKRDGENGIAGIREEAYANYIRALSEKFKSEGKISHTNDTPTTPVFKSSVIFVTKVTLVNVHSLREIKKPEFGHNLHGKLSFKGNRGFWDSYRQNHKSYVDMLKHDSGKPHVHENFAARRNIGSRYGDSHFGEGKTGKTGRVHHGGARADKPGHKHHGNTRDS